MLNARFRPLDHWPGERTKGRKDAQFKANWLQTLDLLEYELRKLRASHVVIQIEDPEQHKRMRNDGSMTVSDKYWPDKPGVILTFESPKGNISMPCDRYRNWRDNLRGIALSLEALRAVDRYGVTRGNEQYRGWTRLEAAGNGNGMDRDKALAFLAVLSGIHSEKLARYLADDLATLIRAQRIAHHPDRATDEQDRARRAELSAQLGQAEHALSEGGS